MNMAWGGKIQTRMGVKQRNHFLKNSHRALPKWENPDGIPKAVMKTLAAEGLSADPVRFNARLQELLAAHHKNGG
jgi:hypothetical protein